MQFEFAEWRALAAQMLTGSPHARALGLTLVELERDHAILKAPYNLDLVGDPETGVIAGGVVTALLDHTCGQAAGAALSQPMPVATLDLRIDYMRPAEPGLDLYAHARCIRLTRTVAFIRAEAYERTRDDPVATAQAAFMLTSPLGRGFGANLKPRGPKGSEAQG